MSFEFRKITENDIGDFYDIRFSVAENKIYPHQVHLLDRNLILGVFQEGGSWICLDAHKKVGICCATLNPYPHIFSLFVRPEYDGNGIGKHLLTLCLDWFRSKNIESVELITDPGSRADGFYQHLGWKRGELDEYGCQVKFLFEL
ncbi:Acetyltransferase domain protein [Mycoavidus cysteinexigens]|uniref:Acetyltransferase domain protein n=1 Tax=Mycoavidus cysteinexigens TaxID=1553431 RepID=A0A2Z6EUQ5_9BURK|nr:GNAT family N-acetyltransferase [Mycoavidus cysteinexigens]BBE09152.1 Acetyltransferase domain protein [Mycoavidus cysteinexigens]GAM52107.1 hypothetical protein EBME_0570 [bacterium endosymbiont of Mortierella elongata FMR23-6]GLR01901.1 hypothetical protein GCM10007934_17130 [Mycoavidus cysteinexigens]